MTLESPRRKKARTMLSEKGNESTTSNGTSRKIVVPEDGLEGEDLNTAGQVSKKMTIVIEYCKQHPAIKTIAIRMKEALEERGDRITLLVNPEKPRKGCFEVREYGGEKFVSLLNMKRPSTQMKNVDVEKVKSDIIARFRG